MRNSLKISNGVKKAIFILQFTVYSLQFTVPSFAQSPQELYARANLNYENQRYDEAIRLYETILNMGRESPAVYYNLGSSYFKLKKLGKAVLNYERALRLAPRDSDIRKNLSLAKNLVVDKIIVPERGFILNLIFCLYDNLNLDELTVLVSIVYFGIIILLILSVFFVRSRARFLLFSAVLAGIFIFVFIFLIAKIHFQQFTKEAVIVVEKVDVRSGPSEDFSLQFTLHEGTKLKIVDEKKDWFEIDLSKDLKGWLPKDSVEQI